MHARVGLLGPAVELGLEVERVGEAPAGLEVPWTKRWERSSAPLAWQSPGSRITQPAASWPQKAAKPSVGRPPPAWIAPSRSQTSFSGSAPSLLRQRFMPQAMSASSFEKTSAPAKARE